MTILTKKQRCRLAASLFALSALLWIAGAALMFVWHRQPMGWMFSSLAFINSSLAFLFYTLSRQPGNGAA